MSAHGVSYLVWLVIVLPLFALFALPASSGAKTATRATTLMALSCCLALMGFMTCASYGPIEHDIFSYALTNNLVLSLGTYYDRLSALLLLLVSSLGFAVALFSQRYLRDDAKQQYFYRYLGLALSAVFMLLTAHNLIIFFLAWVLTSYALHRLLTIYPQRRAALISARKKFLISRLGDIFLLSALCLVYSSFHSLNIAKILRLASEGHLLASDVNGWMGMLLVLAALTKSAQFPFHSWLPDTMESPTPVSVLMHAGIINAGGFLLIRMSPMLSHGLWALDLLLVIGTLTTLLGAVVMMCQTDIKRQLAYSTVAQMGFMMLQCGVGAFEAATLHIVAHSLYKSYAFFSAGTIDRDNAKSHCQQPKHLMAALILASWYLLLAMGVKYLCGHYGVWLGLHKPDALALTVACLIGLAYCGYQYHGRLGLFSHRPVLQRWYNVFYSLLRMTGLLLGYMLVYTWLLYWLKPLHVPSVPFDKPHWWDDGLSLSVCLSLLLLYFWQITLPYISQQNTLKRFYVHAYNGFYLGILANRLVLVCWPLPRLMNRQRGVR